ncbi:MAG TPA: 4Fe-4S binding protein [Propionibacteriaceae bacterium]|nr:4Fe-4S binding protein [Propionibacteriaceae bacterium]
MAVPSVRHPSSGVSGGTAGRRRGPTRAQRRARDMARVKRTRHLVQAAVTVVVVIVALRHHLSGAGSTASIDAVCPFGGVETLVTWLTTGELISRTHPSNLILGAAVVAAAVLVGNAFCGWICPFGAVQDALAWLRRRLRLPTIGVPRRADRIMRYGRFLVLGLVVYASVHTARLWFADYDPYATLFGLGPLLEFDAAAMWPALVITVLVLAASLLVERFWCRYLCPLGAVFSLVGHLSFLRIRRTPSACTACTLCDRTCPVGLAPSRAEPFVSTDCVGCMDCVATCPVKGALGVDGPVLAGVPRKRDLERVSRITVGRAGK